MNCRKLLGSAVVAPAAFCAILCFFAPRLTLAADDAAPMTLDQYQSELRRVAAAMEDQRDHFKPPAGKPEELNAKLPDAWVVEVRGQRYEIPTDDLKFKIDDNKDRTANRVAALNEDIERVKALQAESASLGSGAAASSGDAARAKLIEILKRREFAQSQGRKSWIREMWDRVIGWVEDFLFRLFNGVRKNKVVSNTILYGVIAIGFGLLAWVLVRVLVGASRREALRLEQPAAAVKTAGQWVREAVAAAGRGDYRDAIRCGYWAGVYRLSELGVCDLDQSRTPREYLRLISARGREPRSLQAAPGATLPDPAIAAARATALGELTRKFETVWYADAPATSQDFDSAARNLEKLECRLPLTAPTAGS
jgi:Domain of unknown function (DUF4129)